MLNAIDIIISRPIEEWDKLINTDNITIFGLTKLLEIIGEAAYMLTKDFKEEHSEIQWRYIEDMRHVLVHGYYQVQYSIMRQTIVEDLPMLRRQLERMV